ncbi:MAG: hypothetical protein M3527_08850 [Actinomycetota bacterium]|nr:hypothetical protein [Actinomycetota bacterium]
MTCTALRIGVALLAVGALVIGIGVAAGGDATPSTRPAAAADDDADPQMIPSAALEGPEPVRGQPGSKQQLGLLGGIIAAIGALVCVASVSGQAARRARTST